MFSTKRFLVGIIFLIHIFDVSRAQVPPIPKNFFNDKSWCWFSSALQCFYRIDYARNIGGIFAEGGYEPGKDEEEIFNFYVAVKKVFDEMAQKSGTDERISLLNLYTLLMNEKNTQFLNVYLNELNKRIEEAQDSNQDALLEQYWGMLLVSVQTKMSEKSFGEAQASEIFPALMFCLMRKLVPYGEIFAPFIYMEHFSGNSLKEFSKEISSIISKPITIDGNQFDNPALLTQMITVAPINSPNAQAPAELKAGGRTFELVGVIKTGIGHTIAFVKYGSDWYCFDDASLKASPDKINGEFDRKNCEVAFYTKVNEEDKKVDKKNDIRSQLSELKKKLKELREKLGELSSRLAELKIRLSS